MQHEFKYMFLDPHQIIRKMNELSVKSDLTEVAYYCNTPSQVVGPGVALEIEGKKLPKPNVITS